MDVPEPSESSATLTQSFPCKTSSCDQNSPFKDLPMCHVCQVSRNINVSKCRFVGQLFPQAPLDITLTQRNLHAGCQTDVDSPGEHHTTFVYKDSHGCTPLYPQCFNRKIMVRDDQSKKVGALHVEFE
jgi:hypothetical protein